MDMLPQEIAAKIPPMAYARLCYKVENDHHQKFGVVAIKKNDEGKFSVTVALQDNTHHLYTI